MAKITWSPLALHHLETILEYYSTHSTDFPTTFLNTLEEQLKLIASYPGMGRIIPEMNDANL